MHHYEIEWYVMKNGLEGLVEYTDKDDAIIEIPTLRRAKTLLKERKPLGATRGHIFYAEGNKLWAEEIISYTFGDESSPLDDEWKLPFMPAPLYQGAQDKVFMEQKGYITEYDVGCYYFVYEHAPNRLRFYPVIKDIANGVIALANGKLVATTTFEVLGHGNRVRDFYADSLSRMLPLVSTEVEKMLKHPIIIANPQKKQRTPAEEMRSIEALCKAFQLTDVGMPNLVLT